MKAITNHGVATRLQEWHPLGFDTFLDGLLIKVKKWQLQFSIFLSIWYFHGRYLPIWWRVTHLLFRFHFFEWATITGFFFYQLFYLFFFFLESFKILHLFFIITLYHRIKTPINFFCVGEDWIQDLFFYKLLLHIGHR